MKKSKLSSFIGVFILLISLTGCNQNTELDSSSSSSEDLILGVNDYTLSFTFYDEQGNSAFIPNYATCYINGSYDGYSSFTPLVNNNDGTYTITYSSLQVGTYTYSLLMYYTGENVTWNNSVTICSYETFEVNLDDGDGYTNNILMLLNEELEPIVSDEEIASDILSTLKEKGINDFSSLNYEAYHLEEKIYDYSLNDGYQTISTYMTTLDGKDYGYISEEKSSITYKVINEDVCYIYYPAYRGTSQSFATDSWTDSYGTSLNNYLDVFTSLDSFIGLDGQIASNLSFTLDYNYYLDTYTLLIKTNTDDAYYEYTYTVDLDYELLSFSYSIDNEERYYYYYVEPSTYEDVALPLKTFNKKAWSVTTPTDVEDIFNRLQEEDNYTLGLRYHWFYSDSYTSESALETAYNNNTLSWTERDWYITFSYTKDALLIVYFVTSQGDYIFFDLELIVNDYDNGVCYFYQNYANEYLELAATYNGTWQDRYSYLNDLTTYLEAFTKGDTTVDEDGVSATEYTIDFDTDGLLDTMIDCMYSCGNWIIPFTDCVSHAKSCDFTCTSTYYSYGSWHTLLNIEDTIFSGSSGYYYERDTLAAYIHNVGTSYIPASLAGYLI